MLGRQSGSADRGLGTRFLPFWDAKVVKSACDHLESGDLQDKAREIDCRAILSVCIIMQESGSL